MAFVSCVSKVLSFRTHYLKIYQYLEMFPNSFRSSIQVSDSFFWVEFCTTQKRDGVKFHSSAHGHPVLPTSLIEEIVLSPVYVFGGFLKNQSAVHAWIYFWDLYYYLLVYVYVFMLILYHAFLIILVPLMS